MSLAVFLVWALLTDAGMAQPPDKPQSGQASSRSGRARAASPQKPPVARDEAEQRILSVLDEMYKQRGMQVPVEDGRLLHMLAETAGAKRVVEIGTYRGYSAIWLCLALRTTGGKLT